MSNQFHAGEIDRHVPKSFQSGGHPAGLRSRQQLHPEARQLHPGFRALKTERVRICPLPEQIRQHRHPANHEFHSHPSATPRIGE
jgi:hypothetical protein